MKTGLNPMAETVGGAKAERVLQTGRSSALNNEGKAYEQTGGKRDL